MKDTRLIVLHRKGFRVAQLDLLLRSVERNWPNADPVIVDEPSGQAFHSAVFRALQDNDYPYTAFACDDGVVYRPVDSYRLENTLTLCHSLRLGANTTRCDPLGVEQTVPAGALGAGWYWNQQQGDFAYPGSLDAHVFHSIVLTTLLSPYKHRGIDNPTALECVLQEGCMIAANIYPLMTSPDQSCYVGVPVNRVSDQSGVIHGQIYPADPDELARKYENGWQISLDAINPEAIDAAHTELPFTWEPRVKELV